MQRLLKCDCYCVMRERRVCGEIIKLFNQKRDACPARWGGGVGRSVELCTYGTFSNVVAVV